MRRSKNIVDSVCVLITLKHLHVIKYHLRLSKRSEVLKYLAIK